MLLKSMKGGTANKIPTSAAKDGRRTWKPWLVGLGALLIVACQPVPLTPTPTPSAQPSSTPSPRPTPTERVMTPEPSATKAPDVEGNVSVWLDWTPDELAVLKEILPSFLDEFPGVQVSISFIPPDELMGDFISAAEEGTSPTVLLGPSDWGPDLLERGLIRDISARVGEDTVQAIHPVALQGTTYGTGLLGLPLTMDGVVLYRNRDLVNQAPESFQDIIDISEQISADGQVGSALDYGFLYTGAFLQACDGELLTGDRKLALSPEAIACWLTLLRTWADSSEVTFNSQEDTVLFESGLAGWLVAGSWEADRLLDNLGEEQLAVDPWPVYREGKGLAGYSWTRNAYFASAASSTDYSASWVFVRFLLTPEAQAAFAQAGSGRQVPVLTSLQVEERWLAELIEAMHGNIMLPIYPELDIFAELFEFEARDVGLRKSEIDYATNRLLVKLARELPQDVTD